MTWSYSGDPSSSAKDAVRFLAQDTDDSDPLVNDEEVNWLITQYPASSYAAASAVAETIAAKFAREANSVADGVNVGAQELQQHYITLADRLRNLDRRRGGFAPYVGGISVSDRYDVMNDTDYIPGAITDGLHDIAAAGAQSLVSPPPDNGETGGF